MELNKRNILNKSKYSLAVLRSENIDAEVVKQINALLAELTTRQVKTNTRQLTFTVAREDIRILVVRHDGDIVGMGTLCEISHLTGVECEIHDIVVTRAHRQQGIARAIIDELIRTARDTYQARHISLTSSPDRMDANRLYQSLGFEVPKTNYYRLKL